MSLDAEHGKEPVFRFWMELDRHQHDRFGFRLLLNVGHHVFRESATQRRDVYLHTEFPGKFLLCCHHTQLLSDGLLVSDYKVPGSLAALSWSHASGKTYYTVSAINLFAATGTPGGS